jgi:tetratricopeptide (TPR) repeat protein
MGLARLWRGLRNERVSASGAAVAVGGDIRDSTITVGLDEKAVAAEIQPIREDFAKLAAQIAREKGLDPAPLREILARIGELDVPDDTIPSKLSAMADKLIELRKSLESATGGELSTIKRAALDFVSAGDFNQAYVLLEQGRVVAQLQRENASRTEAEILFDQAQIDELSFSYLAAAEKYSQAAALRADEVDESFKYLTKQANALQNQGEEFGSNSALIESIEIWRRARDLRPFDVAPDDYRKAHNNLGSAIASLAARETSNQLLYEVVAIYRETLTRDTRQSSPLYWIAATSNLASALQTIGGREGRLDLVVESSILFLDALTQVDPKIEASKWAGIQNNIGNSYKLLSEARGSEEIFAAAITAYEAALAVLQDEKDRAQKALILMNLAAVLTELGRFRNTEQPFLRAVSVFDKVFKLVPIERYPMQWAQSKLNLASALNSLGIVQNNVSVFEAAIVAANDALAIYSQNDHPHHWANGRWGVGIALKLIAERTQDLDKAKMAVDNLLEAKTIIDGTEDDRSKPFIASALVEAVAQYQQMRDSAQFNEAI